MIQHLRFFSLILAMLVLAIAGAAHAEAGQPDAGIPSTEPAAQGSAPANTDETAVSEPSLGMAIEQEEAAPEQAPAETGRPNEGQEAEARGSGHGASLGTMLPLWACIPFAGILLSIALFPLFAPLFWHHHYGKVSAFWALVLAVPFLISYYSQAIYAIVHIYIIDYIPFIILLWSLYTVAGGMIIRGTLRGTPALNAMLLLIGTVMASWIGTTGASMVMIRPVLRANAKRRHKSHIIVFFIFLVSNIGGSLTPLGDPPLFLGFLHRVPFFWTFHLIGPMAFVSGILLVLFFILDAFYYRKEDSSQLSSDEPNEPIRVEGLHNLLFLAGIVGAVLASGLLYERFGEAALFSIALQGGREATLHMPWVNPMRDGTLILMGILSLITTNKKLREDNGFTWHAIKEVAYLFAGIFMTIVPALEILHAGAEGRMAFLINAVDKPAHYFWAAGSLSSFLDNAPTYLTFFNTALGRFYAGMPEAQSVPLLVANNHQYLLAIAAGAVFMGANTYIGNAPNFMVKSIAEEAGVKMPSFFGYMLRYSIPILVPLFALVTVIFF